MLTNEQKKEMKEIQRKQKAELLKMKKLKVGQRANILGIGVTKVKMPKPGPHHLESGGIKIFGNGVKRSWRFSGVYKVLGARDFDEITEYGDGEGTAEWNRIVQSQLPKRRK